MFLSVAYRVTCRVLSSVAVLLHREVSKDTELLLLRHENAVLRRQIPLWQTRASRVIYPKV
jgi:hypothetical protein